MITAAAKMLCRSILSANGAVILSEARTICSLFQRKAHGFRTDQRFFDVRLQSDITENAYAIHFDIFFASVASVFKSGVRERGSRPNKFPSANAGSVFNRV